MRFYNIEPKKIYTLKEFVKTQSTKIEDIDSQVTEVCISKWYLFYK